MKFLKKRNDIFFLFVLMIVFSSQTIKGSFLKEGDILAPTGNTEITQTESDSLLPDWLSNKHTGKFKIPVVKCDYLESQVHFYPTFKLLTKNNDGTLFESEESSETALDTATSSQVPSSTPDPNSKETHSSSYYLSAGFQERLSNSKLTRVDYVSNLRRAIDTWMYSHWPLATTGHEVIMTSDLQEISHSGRKTSHVNDKLRVNERPYYGIGQMKTLDNLLKDSPLSEAEKLEAKEVEQQRHVDTYFALTVHERSKSYEGWDDPHTINDELFLEDLTTECKRGTNVVVAVGHSTYFLEFIKKNSNSETDTEKTCNTASNFKLENAAIISTVVKFDKDCKLKSTPLAACKLVYGNFSSKNKSNVNGSNGTSTLTDTKSAEPNCEWNDSLQEKYNKELDWDMNDGDRQVLLFLQRHGKSYSNQYKEDPRIQKIKDSDLVPTGVVQAVGVYKRLSEQYENGTENEVEILI